MQHSLPIEQLRSIRAALDTYRDAVDELERLNWSADVGNSLRRIDALKTISAGRSTQELERLAGLPASG